MSHDFLRYRVQPLPVVTIVHDASPAGGGVASVANSLHLQFRMRMSESCLLSSSSGFISARGIRKLQPCLVHVHGLWTNFITKGTVSALCSRQFLVISPHGMLQPWAMKQKRLKKMVAWLIYQKWLMGRADLLIVNSYLEYRHVRDLGVRVPIAVIPNGVTLDVDLSALQRTDYRKTVLFLSRLAPGKGAVEIIKAWGQLTNCHGYRLRLVGDGEEAFVVQIKNEIERLGLSSSVSIESGKYGGEKWQALTDADLFVLPSHSENFGIVVAEAMFAGLPVITTDQTPWGFLQEEGLGWVCSKDSASLAGVLDSALSLLPQDLKAMGARASEHARREYCWEKISERYIETYGWVVGLIDRPRWVFLD